jgi:hypothetical protein
MGARFRLKSGVDISSFGPESRVIAQAMKDYGLILADNGSPFFFTGASYSVDADNNFALTWNNADDDIFSKTNGLESLHFSDFEVVDLTPVVTGLSGANGPAGTQVTVTGANFSGAAGRLQVLFGQVPATSVTVVDDSHVTAVAPAGSGTVHVRVQSGINDPDDPANLKSPIFGYGVSATSAADQFTYTATAGPIVTKVSAASGPVSGGSLVTVTGTSLADATAVRFGSAKARIKSKTATQIVVFSPPGKAGTVDVRVVSAIGTSPKSPADRFTYLAAPTITKLSRKSGSTSGGTMLTISGKNLANTVIVLFGTVPASIARAMAAQVVVYAPCGKAGTVDVRVVTAGGMSAVTSRDKFTYVYVRNSSAHALHPSLIVDIAKARAKKRGLAAGADPQIAAIGQWSERTYR